MTNASPYAAPAAFHRAREWTCGARLCGGKFAAECAGPSDEKAGKPPGNLRVRGSAGRWENLLAEQDAEALPFPNYASTCRALPTTSPIWALWGMKKLSGAKPPAAGFRQGTEHSIFTFRRDRKGASEHHPSVFTDSGRGGLTVRYPTRPFLLRTPLLYSPATQGFAVEGDAKQNRRSSRKTLLNALETEKNPQTGQPFPRAITAAWRRMACFQPPAGKSSGKDHTGGNERFCRPV